MTNITRLRDRLAALDGTASTDAIASAIVGNALTRVGGVPVADSRAIAEAFGKRHDNVLRDIDRILGALPDVLLNFEENVEITRNVQGAERRRRYFTMNREGFNLLVLGFTGDKALRYRAGFIRAFEWMAENERRQQWDLISSWQPSQSPRHLARKKAAATMRRNRNTTGGYGERGI